MKNKKITIASCGGGTNSKAGLIKWVNDGKPIDLILFADTGGERPETYCEIEKFSHWLAKRGYPEIVTVKYTTGDGSILTLEKDLLANKALPAIAYGYKQCSLKFKIGPQNKFVNNLEMARPYWGSGRKIEKLVFFDAGEEHRILKRELELTLNPDKKYQNTYPLFEDGMNRQDCVDYIKLNGLTVPGKSSCTFCPNMRQMEIRNLASKYPELARRAIEIERNAKPNLTSIKGLGREWSWENFLRQGEMFPEMFPGARGIEICCDCYDG